MALDITQFVIIALENQILLEDIGGNMNNEEQWTKIINKIYNEIPVIKNYKPPMDFDKWEEILGEDIESTYEYNEEEVDKMLDVKWIALARVKDDIGIKYNGEEVFIEDSSRIKMLLDHNLIIRKDKL